MKSVNQIFKGDIKNLEMMMIVIDAFADNYMEDLRDSLRAVGSLRMKNCSPSIKKYEQKLSNSSTRNNILDRGFLYVMMSVRSPTYKA